LSGCYRERPTKLSMKWSCTGSGIDLTIINPFFQGFFKYEGYR
jgi:hypothetical protein